jgi:DNA repair protein RecN (Recombination protein N)
MLKSLLIKNLATIEEVELGLESGFTVLTGETGAGKSILIESIRLALGDKGSVDVIRTGATGTSIEAVFEGVTNQEGDGGEIFVQRRITEKGPGRGYIDGTLAPLKNLRALGDSLVDIYGQNDHVFLRVAENQMDYLDHYAGALDIRKQVARAAASVRQLFRRKRELLSSAQDRKRRLDFLVYQIQEIEKAELTPDEEEEIRAERLLLKNSEKIGGWVEEALSLSYTGDGSLSSLLSRLQPLLEHLAEFDAGCKTASQSVQELAITIKELGDHLIHFRESTSRSPERLEQIETRLSQIEGLKRKYGSDVEEILGFLQRCQDEHAELDGSEERLQEVDEELKDRLQDYDLLSRSLREKRAESARKLEKEVEREIGQLGMKKARFKIELRPRPRDPERLDLLQDSGTEDVEFLLSPNPGEDLKPLRKIASGGELSRFMLALKSVGKDTREGKTLIFDEIDAGIGGRTAEFVALKLRMLARVNQVICITHLPQIASFATHHFRIDKKISRNRTYTGVLELTGRQRIEEIARLLAGSHITPATLKTAREMLESRGEQEPE